MAPATEVSSRPLQPERAAWNQTQATAGLRRQSGNRPARPSSGPGSSNQATVPPQSPTRCVVSWIETMVMAKPMAFWKAKALPTISGGQARAESAEKCGESATTLSAVGGARR